MRREAQSSRDTALLGRDRTLSDAREIHVSPFGKPLQWRNAPKCPGVYGIFLNRRLVYIGKSINMRHRVIDHRCIVKTQKKLNWHPMPGLEADDLLFAFIPIVDSSELRHIEEELIGRYAPRFNRLVNGRRRCING